MRLASSVAAGAVALAMTGPAMAFVNVGDFGASGNGSDATNAIQSAIDTAVSNGGDTVYLPKGTYTISAPLVVANVTGVRIAGDGINATRLQPSGGMGGKPVVQFVDAVSCSVEDLSILGLPSNPPSAGVESDSVSGGEATHLTIKDVTIGSDGAGSLVDGVKFAAQASADYNNDMGFFENVTIKNFTHAGYSILHSNSLVHSIIGGAIVNGPIGVYTQAGSYKMVGTHLENLSDSAFVLDNPNAPQAYQHPIVIADISYKATNQLLRTGSAALMVSITGATVAFAQQPGTIINFQANHGMLFMSNSYLSYGGSNAKFNFVGGANQVVNLTNNFIGPASLSVNGPLFSQSNCWSGKPALAMSGTSTLMENTEMCGSLKAKTTAVKQSKSHKKRRA